MCRADVLWVLYAVCGCVLCMVCAECVLYCAIFTSKKIQKMNKYSIYLTEKRHSRNKTGFRHFLPDWNMTPSGKETGR